MEVRLSYRALGAALKCSPIAVWPAWAARAGL